MQKKPHFFLSKWSPWCLPTPCWMLRVRSALLGVEEQPEPKVNASCVQRGFTEGAVCAGYYFRLLVLRGQGQWEGDLKMNQV